MKPYNSQQIAELANEIIKHKSLYYKGRPAISDVEFDALEEKLRKISPQHPALQKVGFDEVVAGPKIEHTKPMLSLAKTYVIEELLAWAKEEVLMGTLKIDGNSISLVYSAGALFHAKTRGNGRVGEDVTAKIAWVPDCMPTIAESLRIEVRGELFCTEENFLSLVEEMRRLDLEIPTNPRNTVAGILGRKQHIFLARYFSFAAFDVLDQVGESFLATEELKFAWLQNHGFQVPFNKVITNPDGITSFLAHVKDFMAEGDFGVDGAVFTYNNTEMHRNLGDTSHHPRYKMSFKWEGETAVARITDFTWATSRLGIVTPVAIIEPVYLSGALITNITLHNAKHVQLFNLKVGDEIEIVRSGEVIPKFLRVVREGTGKFFWPESCPSCGAKLRFDDVRLLCTNGKKCPAQQVGEILNWIKNAEIDDLSEKRLIPLIEGGLVSHMSDLYRLSVEDFLKLPLTKDKMAQKLHHNIQKSRDLALANFLNGLGIQGAGLSTWESLVDEFPTLEKIQQMTVNDVIKVEGFAEKSATQIVTGLYEKADDIRFLLDVGVRPASPLPKKLSARSELTGKTLVITGTMSKPRDELEKAIKAAGGKVSGAVSKNTYALIIDDVDSTSSKAKKAKELGVTLWTEADLLSRL
jgi:DNA ligase (NAD+)